MFSIVIPLYNKEQNVKRTIDSILNQTFQDFEIVVINDGSTDRSAEIVAGIYDTRIKLIHQENRGVSAARNMGIRSAKYEWIAFLDADDWWESIFLEEIKSAIETYPDHLIFGGRQAIYSKENYLDNQCVLLPPHGKTDVVNYYEALAVGESIINSSNAVVKKSYFFQEGFFIEGLQNNEDINLWLRLCYKQKVVIVSKRLSVYVSYQSYTSAKAGISAKDFMILLNTFIDLKQKVEGENRKYLKIIYDRHCEYVVLRFFNRYSKSDKKQSFKKMAQLIEYTNFYKLRFINFFRLAKTINKLKKIRQKLNNNSITYKK